MLINDSSFKRLKEVKGRRVSSNRGAFRRKRCGVQRLSKFHLPTVSEICVGCQADTMRPCYRL